LYNYFPGKDDLIAFQIRGIIHEPHTLSIQILNKNVHQNVEISLMHDLHLFIEIYKPLTNLWWFHRGQVWRRSHLFVLEERRLCRYQRNFLPYCSSCSGIHPLYTANNRIYHAK